MVIQAIKVKLKVVDGSWNVFDVCVLRLCRNLVQAIIFFFFDDFFRLLRTIIRNYTYYL